VSTETELTADEEFLKGTLSAVSTLQDMVREKQKEIEILEKDRDEILTAVAQVSPPSHPVPLISGLSLIG
jgi:hypothetical protein